MDKEVSLIRMYQPNYGVVRKNKRYCYLMKPSDSNINDTLILLTNLYSGLADLYINKDFLPELTKDFQLKYNIDEIVSTKINNSFFADPITNKLSNLYVCLYANFSASYSLIAYYQSEAIKIQKYNKLISGIPSYGILPGLAVTSYKLLDYGLGTNNSITLSSTSGSPTLSLFYCEEKSCVFDSFSYQKSSKY